MDNRKSTIRPEDRILYLCSRQDFQENYRQEVLTICREGAINWGKLFVTAYQHGIAPLVYVNLNKLGEQDIGVTDEITEKFKLATVNNIAVTGKRTEQMTKIYEFFGSLSVDIMAIKGTALEVLVYDQPWYTMTNDLDLIVKLEPGEFNQSDKWHLEDLKQDIPLEYDFMVHHDVTMNGTLPVNFESIWKDASSIRYKGQKIIVMSPEDMLITSCINSCRKRYFKLKALFDIAEIINKFPDIDWDILVSKSTEYQCNMIVYTALGVTEKTIGCTIPGEVLVNLNLNRNRTKIIQYIMNWILSYPLEYKFKGIRIFERELELSIILPYVSYRWDQIIRKINYVWKTRQIDKYS